MSARDQMIAAVVTVIVVFAAAWAVYWLLRRCRRGGPVARLLERHFREEAAAAEEYLRCNRCRTGSTAFPCTCAADCYSPLCNGWVARAARPAIACRYCAPVFDGAAACTCATPCGDGQCGALAWAAISNTEEWER